MKTEKDTREFFKSNKPVISDSKEFMEELLHQTDLLPTPSSMSGQKSEEEIRSALDLAMRTASELKRQFRIRAMASAVVGMLLIFAAGLIITAIGPDMASLLPNLLPKISI